MEMKKKWQIPEPVRITPELMAAAGDPVIAEILYRRGYTTAEQMINFLQPADYRPCDFAGDPLLAPLIERIERALADKEKITVYGDYDVDGITSTAVWMHTLHSLGAQAGYHVPDRFTQGYGINSGVLRELADAGTKLIITCDCGIANYDEIEEATDLGIDVLVTDHHELPAKLPAVPVFNPKMLSPDHPAYTLPGVGVSFVIAKELLSRAGRKAYADNLLDMVALGIIADVVPLIKDNRWYLKQGLPNLLASTRPGIRALLEVAKIHSVYGTEEDIAFQVVPRLNAAGRLASACLAVDLLLAADLPAAQKLAAELDRLNESRKILCDRMMREALSGIGGHADEMPAITLYGENWHEGVIGIVAGRLAEQYRKPALLMTRKENGLITGSARTEGNMNIYQILSACQELLLKFGGHEGAAGFSLRAENLELFREKIKTVVGEIPAAITDGQPLLVDALLTPKQINIDLYQRIRDLGPFGQGNPPPILLIDGQLVNNQLMKTGSAHRRLRFVKNGQTADAVWWNSAQAAIADQDQFLARLRLNLYRDNVNVQLDILDVISYEQAEPIPAGEFIDMRGRSVEELKQRYPQALFFCDGEDSVHASRRELRANDTLVMLTIPAKAVVWAEILHEIAPRQVVIAWDTQEKLQGQVINDAWRQLMGMVKFSLRVYDGIMTLRRAAIHLGWTQDIVKAGLSALADMGLLEIMDVDEERMTLSIRQNVRPDPRNVQSCRCFAKMLAEAEAYRNYMRNLPVEKIQALLQGGRPACNHDLMA